MLGNANAELRALKATPPKAPLLPPALPGPQAALASWLRDLTAVVEILAKRAHGETVGHRTKDVDADDLVQKVVLLGARYRG